MHNFNPHPKYNTHWRGNLYDEVEDITDSETSLSLNRKYPNKFKGTILSNPAYPDAIYNKISKDRWIKLSSGGGGGGNSSAKFTATSENTSGGVSISHVRIPEGVTSVILNDYVKNTGYDIAGDTLTFNDGTEFNLGSIITLNFG